MELFGYSDHESQALHLSQYLHKGAQVFNPGDLETQPLYLESPTFPVDACVPAYLLTEADLELTLRDEAAHSLEVLLEGAMQLAVAAEAAKELQIGSDGSIGIAVGESASEAVTAAEVASASIVICREAEETVTIDPVATEPTTEQLPPAIVVVVLQPMASFVLIADLCEV